MTMNVVFHTYRGCIRFGQPLHKHCKIFRASSSRSLFLLCKSLPNVLTAQWVTNCHRSLPNQARFSSGLHGGDSSGYSERSLNVAYFIEDEDWVLKVLEATDLLNARENDSPIVFLSNPGNSPLTRLLLEMTQCPVITWEPREMFSSHLQAVADEFTGRHFHVQKSFNKERNFDIQHYFKHLEKDQTIKLIGNVSQIETYIPKLVFSFCTEDGLLKLGNVPHFLFVTGLEYKLMTEADYIWAHKIYQRTSLYKIFFDVKHVLTVPIEAFNRRLAYKSEKFNVSFDKDNMYVVEICLQDDWFSSASKTDCLCILRLLKRISCSKGQRAIPTMEKWCPDIGLSLLSHGVGMMDKIKDVPLTLWPLIYQDIIQNKHFPYSPMRLIFDGKEASHITTKQFLQETYTEYPNTPNTPVIV